MADESCGTRSGYSSFRKRTQPGQHDVNIGRLNVSGCETFSRNSFASSMIVRSAAKFVSKT